MFNYADENDRASNFSKGIVKAYYTAGHLVDVLTTFGALDESMERLRKYAKWKATYIHNCLKNGETPVPGPPGEQKSDDKLNEGLDAPPPVPSMQDFGFQQPPAPAQNMAPHPPHGGYSTAAYPDHNQQPGYPSTPNYGFQQHPQQPQYHQPTPPPRPSVQPHMSHGSQAVQSSHSNASLVSGNFTPGNIQS